MIITAINVQLKNPNRVSIFIDGHYNLSLDIVQLNDIKLKVGQEIDEAHFHELERASQFGKLYTRTLEYLLMRPHSRLEVKQYLHRKTLDRKYKVRGTTEYKVAPGIEKSIADSVLNTLVDRGYIDDRKFASYWVENRHIKKGVSHRKLVDELSRKGVDKEIIREALNGSDRNNQDELEKMITKKSKRYADNHQEFMAYLCRQGFSYGDVRESLNAYFEK